MNMNIHFHAKVRVSLAGRLPNQPHTSWANGGFESSQTEITARLFEKVAKIAWRATKCPKSGDFHSFSLLTPLASNHNVRCNAVKESLAMTSLVVIVGTKRMGR